MAIASRRTISLPKGEVQTRIIGDASTLKQHSTLAEAYSEFRPSHSKFKISFEAVDGSNHRWIWDRDIGVWVDRPIRIEMNHSEKDDVITDEIDRLTDLEFRARYL